MEGHRPKLTNSWGRVVAALPMKRDGRTVRERERKGLKAFVREEGRRLTTRVVRDRKHASFSLGWDRDRLREKLQETKANREKKLSQHRGKGPNQVREVEPMLVRGTSGSLLHAEKKGEAEGQIKGTDGRGEKTESGRRRKAQAGGQGGLRLSFQVDIFWKKTWGFRKARENQEGRARQRRKGVAAMKMGGGWGSTP